MDKREQSAEWEVAKRESMVLDLGLSAELSFVLPLRSHVLIKTAKNCQQLQFYSLTEYR